MLLVVVVPALLMVSNVRYRSFRSLVSPKSGKPYGLVVTVLLVVAGLVTVPTVTCCVVAYSYLVSPLVMPVLTPLGRLVPARVKEVLS
jgi:CDP-diacylglycerol---serine O-phosphatidyltransferase